jgi:adenylate kinase
LEGNGRDDSSASGGKISEEAIVEAMKGKLSSWRCQNQGFILDGYPQTLNQAELLFTESESEGKEIANFMPEFVIVLEGSDELLRNRILNMNNDEIIENHNDEEGDKNLKKNVSF